MHRFFFLILLLSLQVGAQQPKLVMPLGAYLSELKFSPDSRRIVSASDKVVQLWDVASGRVLANLYGHTEPADRCFFSFDSKYIVSSARTPEGFEIKQWDAQKGSFISDIKTGNKSFSLNDVSPIAAALSLVSEEESQVKVIDLEGKALAKLTVPVNSQAYFSPNGKMLIIIYNPPLEKPGVMIYDLVARRLIRDFTMPVIEYSNSYGGMSTKLVSFARIVPGTTHILIGFNGDAILYDITSGKVLYTLKDIATTMTEELLRAEISPDGQFIITPGEFSRSMRVWNVADGRLLFSRKAISFSRPSLNNRLVYSLDENSFEVLSLKNNKVMSKPVVKDFKAEEVLISPDERILLARNGFWSMATGRFLYPLYNGFTSGVSLSPDGQKIFSHQESVLRVFDRMTGLLLYSLSHGRHKNIMSFVCTNDNTRILTAGADYEVKLWDLPTGRLLSAYKHEDIVSHMLMLNNGNKVLTASKDYLLHVWDAASGRELYKVKAHSDDIELLEISKDEKWILTSSKDNTAKLWSTEDGRLIAELQDKKNELDKACFFPDGKKIWGIEETGELRIWNTLTGEMQTRITAFVPDSNSEYLQIAERFTQAFLLPGEMKMLTTESAASDTILKLWDITTGKLVRTFAVQGSGGISFSAVTGDGKKILAGYEDKFWRIWDTESDRLLVKAKFRDDQHVSFSKNEKLILGYGLNECSIWDAVNGKLLATLNGHSDFIEKMGIIDEGNFAYTISRGMLKTWGSAGQPGCTIITADSINLFYQLPDGYFRSGKDAIRQFHYVTKDLRVVSFDQLDIRYNRPDKVLEAIGNTDTALIKSYRKAWEKRIKKLGIDTTQFRDGYSVPEADIMNRDSIDYEQKTGTLRLHIKGTDSTYKLDRFNVWVNESPLYGQRGIRIRKKNSNSIDTTITIQLSKGENRIETSITNVNGTESYRMPLYVNYTAAVKQKEMTRFIGIGIDQFKESNYNLQYSSKDIRDLAVKLKEKYKDNIIIDTLFNEDVTTEKVKALKQKLQQTTVNDKVIISYSGHGLLSKDYDYYLSTYAVNFGKPEENGLPYDELENLLDSIPARKKLLLIDACHSGEVDKEEGVAMQRISDSLGLSKGIDLGKDTTQTQHLGLKNSFELMQSLFVNVGKSTGATIISAAAGNQFALERGDLKNGVFTYSLLEAMNQYPTIKISEFRRFVGERVLQLTNGLQQPTSRNEILSMDWNLW